MANPMTGMGGGMAKKIMQQQMQQMQQMQQQTPQNKVGQDGGASKFQKSMTQQVNQTQKTQQVQTDMKVNQNRKVQFNRSQRVGQTQKASDVQTNKLNANQGPGIKQKLSGFLDGLNNRKKGVDKLLKQALEGKVFNNREMLALQFKMSQFSLEMDLTSKVVDKAVSGIKQAMQTQV